MTAHDASPLVVAALLVLLAGLLASAEAALSSISKVRAEELRMEGRAGAARLQTIVADTPRYLNTAMLVRMLCETTAVVLVTVVSLDVIAPQSSGDSPTGRRWLAFAVAAGVMLVVSYVAVGVGPRTIGRQHSERVALVSGGPVAALTAVLGPIAQLLIMIGNAITPGQGFREGPFASEAELRELVDLAEASRLIESEERRMIHSVFELGDTIVREVMVPRTDMVFIERHKTLRQMMSLALRSGYSRMPVVGENLDDLIGIVYLKDVTKRVFDRHEAETTERVETAMRPCYFVPDSKPVNELMRDMQAKRTHVAIVLDEYGGTAGMVTIEDILEEIVGEITDEYDVEPEPVAELPGGALRVPSRMSIDELGERFGVEIDDEDVDTVGGLMAKHLGKVPIPGAEVVAEGLHFHADGVAGRRNRLGTVVVSRVQVHAREEEDGSTPPMAAEHSAESSGNGP